MLYIPQLNEDRYFRAKTAERILREAVAAYQVYRTAPCLAFEQDYNNRAAGTYFGIPVLWWRKTRNADFKILIEFEFQANREQGIIYPGIHPLLQYVEWKNTLNDDA